MTSRPNDSAFDPRDLFFGWLAATLLSGIPSTLYAFCTGGDVMEATRAAGSMLLPGETALGKVLAAATVVHFAVSLFWSLVLIAILPRRHIALWAVAASAGIAVVDLLIIAPIAFPQVAALDFWPQFADHIMWGASFGLALQLRRKIRHGKAS